MINKFPDKVTMDKVPHRIIYYNWRFKDVMEQEEGYYYSYSPCGSFSEVECKQATACVLDQNKKQSQQIGDSGRAAFQYDADAGNVVVAYTAGTGVLKVFGVLVSYLIGGILFMKFVKKAEGSEAIPNKGFWASIPRNVVNGCKFTVSKIRRKDVTYDQI
ncbi:hypothetical protein MAR_006844 [Mya arenaria]|uniref:Uncharacterized protein n=1 Tax=Mya arenaria TaxID=6604 RepID=A0ABY7DBU2_MYAAR|nr:hypothetical protein MAR_006844 [Mya arenaria]